MPVIVVYGKDGFIAKKRSIETLSTKESLPAIKTMKEVKVCFEGEGEKEDRDQRMIT